MNSTETYKNYPDAFSYMQACTKSNIPFKMMFKKDSGETKIVSKTLLRKQTPSSSDSMGSYKLNYIDVENDRLGCCYIPLIMAVNDIKIILK